MTQMSIGKLFRQVPELINWLKPIVNKVECSRLSHYETIAEKFFNREITTLDNIKEDFIKMSDSILEIVNMILIMNTFKNCTDEGFYTKIRHAVDGKDFITQASEGTSRNYIFELLMAASFSTAGYEIDFSSDADFIAKKDNIDFYGECKKIYSIEKLENNIKKAGKQLENRINNISENIYGIIFIDISYIFNNNIDHFAHKNKEYAINYINKHIEELLNKHLQLVDKYNDIYSDVSLGTYIFCESMIWTEAIETYFTANRFIRVPESMDDDLFNMINKILKAAQFSGINLSL